MGITKFSRFRDSSFSLRLEHTTESLYQNWLSQSTYHLYAADHPGERGPLEDFIEKCDELPSINPLR